MIRGLIQCAFLILLLVSPRSFSLDLQRRVRIMNRRSFFASSSSATAGASIATAAATTTTTTTTTTRPAWSVGTENLPVGLLESRVTEESVLSSPTYGMETPDIVYPSFFGGTWQVSSTTTKVLAPCGMALFGGNATYQRAVQEVGTSLNYQSRFLPVSISSNNNGCIADREFNVKSLAKVALGVNSVVDVRLATPNQFSCILAPNGSPSLLRVDLLTLQRRQEQVSDVRFDCSEVVQEIVTVVADPNTNGASSSSTSTTKQPSEASSSRNPSPLPLLKQVETTSLYTLVRPDKISCQQRSATFLVPPSSMMQTDSLQQQQLQLALYQAARGRPVDVRFYSVEYTSMV